MNSMRRAVAYLSAAALLATSLLATSLLAQEAAQEKPEQEGKKPVYASPSARLAAAKTAVVQNAGGSAIPYNVISSGLEGWGRFRLVDSRAEADVVVEVSSPDDDNASVSSKTRVGTSGKMEDSNTTSRNLSNGAVKLVVYDAKTHIPLWSASEQPKGGFRQRAREDHLVEAAQRLLAKFRERVEPPPPSPQ
jgi:hypothetical protein